jgi:hypothetical protein
VYEAIGWGGAAGTEGRGHATLRLDLPADLRLIGPGAGTGALGVEAGVVDQARDRLGLLVVGCGSGWHRCLSIIGRDPGLEGGPLMAYPTIRRTHPAAPLFHPHRGGQR